MTQPQEAVHSRIWEETPEPDNPFAAATCYCAGYDVYGDLLGRASWAEYLYLLFKGERPSPSQARLLENLAVALANPGPREASVHAAMCGGTGGSTHASSLMAALAVGAGQLGGAHEVALAVAGWQSCGMDLAAWRERLQNPPEGDIDVWPPMEHPPGFDPHGAGCATPVRQTLAKLKESGNSDALAWLYEQRPALEALAGHPLSMSGVAAAALFDLGMDSDQAEMLYLLLRLPGAAVHALEQKEYGWRRFPFFAGGLKLVDDPGPKQV
ncbi:MAG TPA: citryl-CoA lyase [Methylococcaceae bacterium]|nr:citryl-CoA lyase [Methylococcaceae bacterium]